MKRIVLFAFTNRAILAVLVLVASLLVAFAMSVSVTLISTSPIGTAARVVTLKFVA